MFASQPAIQCAPVMWLGCLAVTAEPVLFVSDKRYVCLLFYAHVFACVMRMCLHVLCAERCVRGCVAFGCLAVNAEPVIFVSDRRCVCCVMCMCLLVSVFVCTDACVCVCACLSVCLTRCVCVRGCVCGCGSDT